MLSPQSLGLAVPCSGSLHIRGRSHLSDDLFGLVLSLFQWDGVSPNKVWVGFENYVELFTANRVFWIALKNNVFWSLLSLVIPTGIGLGLALLLNTAFRGSSFFRSVFYFPAILSMSIVGLIWSWMYHPTLGLINQSLVRHWACWIGE